MVRDLAHSKGQRRARPADGAEKRAEEDGTEASNGVEERRLAGLFLCA